MEFEEIIEELEYQRKFLEIRIEQIDDALRALKQPTNFITCLQEKKNEKESKKKVKISKSNEEKKKEAKLLITEGKLSRQEIADKVGVHVASIYNWFGKRKTDKKVEKKIKKNLCSHCNEKPAKCVYRGKDVCKRCFDILKFGEPHVQRREKKDAEYYDDVDALAEDLE